MIKKRMKRWFVFFFLGVSGFFYGEDDSLQLIQKMEKMLMPESAIYTVDFIIVRGSESFRYKLKMWSRERNFVARVEYPQADKGTIFLYKDDTAWIYYPSIQKVVRSSGKQKVLGSDFSIADFSVLNLQRDYSLSGVLLESKNPYLPQGIQKVVKCRAKEGVVVGYPLVYVYFGENDVPLAQEYYTYSGQLLSTILYEDVKDLGGVYRPTKIVMRTTLVEKNYSEIVYQTARYVPISPSYFSPERMKSLAGE